MKRFYLSSLFWIALVAVARTAQPDGTEAIFVPMPPKFELKLNLNEFSVLNVSHMDGLLKYGGSGEFRLKMAKEGELVAWTVTIDNPRQLELLGIFLGERTIKLVQGLDLDDMDPNQKLALETIKSLTKKLELAQLNPIWELTRVSGYVVREKDDLKFVSTKGIGRITGRFRRELKELVGKPLVATGVVKVKGEIELVNFLEKRSDTLELFVMSFCPFAHRAETLLFDFLEQTNAAKSIKLEIRYLFYKQSHGGTNLFSALHGEEEVNENLLQIVLRDRYPMAFRPYVRLRTTAGNAPFVQLAVRAGLTETDVQEINQIIARERAALLQKEYDYAARRYEIFDGSPTFVWESERVHDLRKIEAFKDLAVRGSEACAK